MSEARRFLRRAEELLAEDDRVKRLKAEAGDGSSNVWLGPFWGSKVTGATRRASMDLTRALAEMRRPS